MGEENPLPPEASRVKEDCFHIGVKAIIRNQNGEILLLEVNPEELKEPKEHGGKPYWDIPGGRIKLGDTLEDTLRREVEEETGITSITGIKPFSMVLSNIRIPVYGGDVGLILASYLCDVGDVDVRISSEHLKAEWFPPQEAAELLRVKYPEEFVEKLRELS